MKKKILAAILLVVASTSWTNSLYAAEYLSGITTVRRILTMSNRPNNPTLSHKIFFSLTDMSWVPSTCVSSYIVLPDTEKMSAAALLSAYLAKKSIRVYVDDTLKTEGYCQAVIVQNE